MASHTTSSPASPAIAKAKLISTALRAASRAQLDARAQAVLAHLVADSWWIPDDQAWIARISSSTLEERLTCSEQSIRRAIADLINAGLVRRTVGIGQTRSSFMIDHSEQFTTSDTPDSRGTTGGTSEVPPAAGQRYHGRDLRGATRGASEVPPVAPCNTQSSGSPPPPPPESGAAAGGLQPLSPDQIAIAQVINQRPKWLGGGLAWIDADCCAQLARSPSVTITAVQAAISDAYRKRNELKNPAGHVIKLLRKAGEQLVYRTAFQEDEDRRRAANAAEFPQ